MPENNSEISSKGRDILVVSNDTVYTNLVAPYFAEISKILVNTLGYGYRTKMVFQI